MENVHGVQKNFANSAADFTAFTWVAWVVLRPPSVSAVSRIDRCIHYSGAKSFVNNGLHESFLGSWLQRGTRVPT